MNVTVLEHPESINNTLRETTLRETTTLLTTTKPIKPIEQNNESEFKTITTRKHTGSINANTLRENNIKHPDRVKYSMGIACCRINEKTHRAELLMVCKRN